LLLVARCRWGTIMGKQKREAAVARARGAGSDESYISDLAGQLARIAESRGHPELAAVLDMAKLEAERLSDIQRLLPSVPSGRRGE
jgi:hypothetical protein